MTTIDTAYFERCIGTLEKAYELLLNAGSDTIEYDMYRSACIILPEAGERWLAYRDNRNSTAHDYGVRFSEETLSLLPQFIVDATALAAAITLQQNDLKTQR